MGQAGWPVHGYAEMTTIQPFLPSVLKTLDPDPCSLTVSHRLASIPGLKSPFLGSHFLHSVTCGAVRLAECCQVGTSHRWPASQSNYGQSRMRKLLVKQQHIRLAQPTHLNASGPYTWSAKSRVAVKALVISSPCAEEHMIRVNMAS